MENSQEYQEKVQELNSIEQNFQVFSQQKQSVQIELNEVDNATSEVSSSKDDEIYKILSGIMVKSSKSAVLDELKGKKEQLQKRLEAMENQSALLEKRSKELREEISNSMSKESKEDKDKK